MLAQFPDFTRILPFAAFGLFAAGAWALFRWLAPASSRAEQRLARLHRQNSNSRKNGAAGDKPSAMTDWLKKATRKSWHTNRATAYLKQLRIPQLSPTKKDGTPGWRWRGVEAASTATMVKLGEVRRH